MSSLRFWTNSHEFGNVQIGSNGLEFDRITVKCVGSVPSEVTLMKSTGNHMECEITRMQNVMLGIAESHARNWTYNLTSWNQSKCDGISFPWVNLGEMMVDGFFCSLPGVNWKEIKIAEFASQKSESLSQSLIVHVR